MWFRQHRVGGFRADVLVESVIMLELKSARWLEPSHEAQLPHYLKSTEVVVMSLRNVGVPSQFRRLLFADERKKVRENPCKSVAGVLA